MFLVAEGGAECYSWWEEELDFFGSRRRKLALLTGGESVMPCQLEGLAIGGYRKQGRALSAGGGSRHGQH